DLLDAQRGEPTRPLGLRDRDAVEEDEVLGLVAERVDVGAGVHVHHHHARGAGARARVRTVGVLVAAVEEVGVAGAVLGDHRHVGAPGLLEVDDPHRAGEVRQQAHPGRYPSPSRRGRTRRPQVHVMSEDEIRAFLSTGTRTGKLAVVRRDGRPLVTPGWVVLDGGALVLTTGAPSVN